MTGDGLSRRFFLQGSGTIAGSSLLRLTLPGVLAVSDAACQARDNASAFDVLSSSEAREFEAIAARILPTTATPGAREAGVIYFIDKAFGSIMADRLPFARRGLVDFEAGVSSANPGIRRFSDLDGADQDAYLRTQETSEFFALVRFMTLCGFFGMSSYGGNRNNVGWELIGFDGHRGAWQPPFGYYDAEYVREKQNAD